RRRAPAAAARRVDLTCPSTLACPRSRPAVRGCSGCLVEPRRGEAGRAMTARPIHSRRPVSVGLYPSCVRVARKRDLHPRSPSPVSVELLPMAGDGVSGLAEAAREPIRSAAHRPDEHTLLFGQLGLVGIRAITSEVLRHVGVPRLFPADDLSALDVSV